MDHMLELARHSDLLEALSRTSSDETAEKPVRRSADELLEVSFLATDHPNTWVTEVVHAFYAKPALASQVWVNLRYCSTFLWKLAHRERGEPSGVPRWARRRTGTGAASPENEQTDLLTAIVHYAKKLGSNRRDVDQKCHELDMYPDPPTFLDDLMEADGVPQGDREARTRLLLANPEEVRRLAHEHNAAVPFSIVQEGELEQICRVRCDARPMPVGGEQAERNRRTCEELLGTATTGATNREPARYRRHSARQALDMDLLGFAFSGGGIRSATFNLGVLQALSKIGLLKRIDYLSTVSGGGYIGTWLAGWIRRMVDERASSTAPDQQPQLGREVLSDIQRRLSPERSPNPMDERVRPIRFLREYSNYLTPRAGVFSADTWTMIGIYVRNTLLNQIIIVSLFAVVLLMPRNWFALSTLLAGRRWPAFLALVFWVVGATVLAWNLRQLDPRRADPVAGAGFDQTPREKKRARSFERPLLIHLFVVLPWLIAAALGARSWGVWALSNQGAHVLAASIAVGLLITVSLAFILSLGRSDRCWAVAPRRGADTRRPSRKARDKRDRALAMMKATGAIAGSALVAGIVAAGLTRILLRLLLLREASGFPYTMAVAIMAMFGLDEPPLSNELMWHLEAIGTAGFLSVFSLAIVAMLGMLGRRFPDEHREWWSRLRTVIHIYAIGWLAWFVVAVYIPWGVHALMARTIGWKSVLAALATWIGSTVFGVRKGPQAEQDQKKELESIAPPSLSSRLFRYAALAAPYVFIVGLVLALALAIDAIYLGNASDAVRMSLSGPQALDGAYWRFATWTSETSWICTLVAAGIGLLFTWRVDINDFSIHHFYKNRLVRCYLGASHTVGRKPDWFTGFDPNDDLPLMFFDHAAPNGRTPYPGPYPIVNCALNLVRGQDLAWQERKATSFVFTPKYCGFDIDRAVLTPGRAKRDDGYVETQSFYDADRGPLLGMAMAISGAAANPNMGRASTPALAFLMTVFNVRLGWWVGNPRHPKGACRPSPGFGLRYTLLELFGATDDTRKYINLSDGGHFDNLGVYELIRRSCRYVVVCDAGQDPKFVCEDLGHLVRRCRTDFGVEIDISLDRIRHRDNGKSQTHCVVGRIHYLNLPRRVGGKLVAEDGGPLLPGCRPAHEVGYLIYIKPSITGDEPHDVLEYSRRIPEFPHQSTADQWFDESQFESYRKLGMHIGEETFARYQKDDTRFAANMEELFARLYKYWYPPSTAINDRSTEHAAEYSRIMELLRSERALERLDHVVFDRLPSAAIQPRKRGWLRSLVTGDGSERAQPERDEFYICNALIQLTENVYADLDLEHNWKHPHVEGWMQLFREWAQQPAFRRTWRISEPTYAERFRNFYNDRLRGRPLPFPRAFIASHRGRIAGGDEEGNTLTYFFDAIRAGAAAIETDVRRLGSGELIIHHDETLAGRAVAHWEIDALRNANVHVLTLEKCLRKLRGVQAVSRPSRETNPLVRLDLELKMPGLERDVLDLLRRTGWSSANFVLTSFHKDMPAAVRAVCSDVRVGLLVEKEHEYDDAFANFLLTDADFLAPNEACLTADKLDDACEARVPLVPWTVNAEEQLRMFLAHDAVIGVITDYVSRAMQVKATL